MKDIIWLTCRERHFLLTWGYYEVDKLGLRYKFVNFGAEKAQVHQVGEPRQTEIEMDHFWRRYYSEVDMLTEFR